MTQDSNLLEEKLKAVWEKVRAASNLVLQLRDEKKSLTARAIELEKQVSSARAEILLKDQELKRLRSEYAHVLNSHSQNGFSPEEKDNIRGKIRDLISKINSHL